MLLYNRNFPYYINRMISKRKKSNFFNQFFLQNEKFFFQILRNLRVFAINLMYIQQKYIEKPFHLVEVNSQGELFINHDTADFISTLKAPLGILSIAGPYRTGKSFLMNSLIQRSEAFEVGNTTKATTKGLWVWGKPILGNDTNSKLTNVLVIDSEGFGNTQDTHDKRITTLALLLSTCFLYNSRGSIDKDSIFDLEYIIDIARSICVTENVTHRTDFHWILRDFHLELVNQMGNAITPNQYLENSLFQSQQKVSKSTVETLKSYFPNRNCHCLVKPNLTQNQRPQFIEQIIQLRKIMNSIRSIDINGRTFMVILKTYVQAINTGQSLPKIFQQGYQCRVRLTCLQKLQNQLREIQEKAHDGEQIDQKIQQLKKQLRIYSMDRMCSQKQLEALQIDINQMIAEFNEIVKPRQTTSIKVFQKRPKAQIKSSFRKSKYAIKIKQLEQEVNNTKNLKDNQIKVEKLNTIRMKEDYETKLIRCELQVTSSRRQVIFFKQQMQKTLRQKEKIQDSLNLMIEENQKKQKQQNKIIRQFQQEIQNLKNQNTLTNCQMIKLQSLNLQKIQFLEKSLRSHQLSKAKIQNDLQIKYKDRINDLMNQIKILNEDHQIQIEKIKEIYKIQTSCLIKHDFEQNTHLQLNFMNQYKINLKLIEQMRQQNQNLQSMNVQLQMEIQNLKSKSQILEHRYRENIQLLNKKSIQKQRQLMNIYESKISNKESIIENEKNKVKQLNQIIQAFKNSNIQKISEDQKRVHEDQIMNYQSQIIRLNEYNIVLEKKYNELSRQIEAQNIINFKLNGKNDQMNKKIQQFIIQLQKNQLEKSKAEIFITELRINFEIQKEKILNKLKVYQSKIEEERSNNFRNIESFKNSQQIQKQKYDRKVAQLQIMNKELEKYKAVSQNYQQLQLINISLQNQLLEVNKSSRMTIQKFDLKIQQLIQQNCNLEIEKKMAKQNEEMCKKTFEEKYKKIHQINEINYKSLQQKYDLLMNNQKKSDLQMCNLKKQNLLLNKKIIQSEQNAKNRQNQHQQLILENSQLKQQIQRLAQKCQSYQVKQRLITEQLAVQKQKKQMIYSTLVKLEVQNKQISNLIQTQRQNFKQSLVSVHKSLKESQEGNDKLLKEFKVQKTDKDLIKSNLQDYEHTNINQNINYRNHLRLFQRQIKNLKQLCQQNERIIQEWKQKYRQCLQQKNQLNINYQKDFQLWKHKFIILEERANGSKKMIR